MYWYSWNVQNHNKRILWLRTRIFPWGSFSLFSSRVSSWCLWNDSFFTSWMARSILQTVHYNVSSCWVRTNHLRHPAGSKKIEKDRNWGMGKDHVFFYLRTYPEWLGISIFSYLLVYLLAEVVSIFFSIFRDRLLVSFSIPYLSHHSANFNLSL